MNTYRIIEENVGYRLSGPPGTCMFATLVCFPFGFVPNSA